MQSDSLNRGPKLSRAPIQARKLAVGLLRLRYKRKIILLVVLSCLFLIMQFVFPQYLALESLYNNYVFRPFQSIRNLFFGLIYFSVGDFLYLVAFLVCIAVLIRWIYFLIRIRSYHHDLAHSFLNTFISFAFIYLLFFIGWGGNYYKPTLTKFWKLSAPKGDDRQNLLLYDQFLIGQLNQLAPGFQGRDFKHVDDSSSVYFRKLVDSKTRLHHMRAKASLYGYFMQYMGIQGYYNPFTGEAQVNGALPRFMLPFVVCHEMAHQSGIAAEDDANLLSYSICSVAPDPAFRYSGYFNLWLYTHFRLKHIDSSQANNLFSCLNALSKSQLDTLKAIRLKYRSGFSDFSSALYDSYLRLHHQKDGIGSYNNVALSAWALELRRRRGPMVISIP